MSCQVLVLKRAVSWRVSTIKIATFHHKCNRDFQLTSQETFNANPWRGSFRWVIFLPELRQCFQAIWPRLAQSAWPFSIYFATRASLKVMILLKLWALLTKIEGFHSTWQRKKSPCKETCLRCWTCSISLPPSRIRLNGNVDDKNKKADWNKKKETLIPEIHDDDEEILSRKKAAHQTSH